MEQSIVLYDDPAKITLEEFKNFVKKWLEYDNYIKKAQEVIKEKRVLRDKLSQVIIKFMTKYNIEDLNTKEGRIRCKTTQVKPPVSQKCIKERLNQYFDNDERKKEEVLSTIYKRNDEKIEKTSLRRLKIS